ncbi:amidohydrolase [Oceanobacillus kapialis]|uniref:amidohydrolase n=1 Tax=Oceanobacillus kapialis TaxID=481353 RepID=UPI00384CD4FD
MTNVDLLFKNGNVLTLDKNNTIAGSVAVSDGRIIGIWSEPEPPKETVEISSNTTVIDLKGDTLLPGFIDTHNHILTHGLMRDWVDCSTPPNKTIKDIKSAISNATNNLSDGDWVQGYGYDDTLLEDQRHPTRHDLDEVSPNNPVFIKHISGHLAVANSVAMELAGLNVHTDDPPSGHFGRDDNGKLNGVLYEHEAMQVIQQIIPQKTVDEMVINLEKAAYEYISHGITTNSDAAVRNRQELEVHLKAAKTNKNSMRTQLMIMHNLFRNGEVFGAYTPEELNKEIMDNSNGLAKLDSAKMFQDGSIQGLTGALREDYYKNPGLKGDLIHDQESFQEEVLDLHRRGFRITTHGNGDRAIGSILDAYEYALSKHPRENHKHRIEHVQAATPGDLEKMATLDVAGSFFINHVYYWGDRHKNIFLGPERAKRISPLAEAVQHNLLFTLHSDCPITPISPLFSVWAAVNRITRNGEILGPEQKIDVITALKAMTIYGAELIFDSENLGSIEVGKLADFTILEADPTTVDPIEIKDIKIKSTIINGKIVYGNKSLVLS